MVLAIAFLIIALFLVKKISEGSNAAMDEEGCRQQVLKHALSLKYSANTLASEIRCPVRQVEVKGGSEEQLGVIAEEMRKCWYSFLEGKQRVFKGTGVFCHPCSVLRFKEGGDLEGLTDYLLTNDIPGGGVSYAAYLSGYSSKDAPEEIKQFEEVWDKLLKENEESFLSIDRDKDYAVLFLTVHGNKFIKDVSSTYTKKKFLGVSVGLIGKAGLGVMAVGRVVLLVPIPGFRIIGGAIMAAGGAISAIPAAILFEESAPEWLSLVVLTEYNEEALKGLGCSYEPINIKEEG